MPAGKRICVSTSRSFELPRCARRQDAAVVECRRQTRTGDRPFDLGVGRTTVVRRGRAQSATRRHPSRRPHDRIFRQIFKIYGTAPRTLRQLNRTRPAATQTKKACIAAGLIVSGSPRRTRTADPVINSHLLYRLSYRGMREARDFADSAGSRQAFLRHIASPAAFVGPISRRRRGSTACTRCRRAASCGAGLRNCAAARRARA